MDISQTIVPKSDQLNADDLLAGPATVRIVKVSRGNAEQPVNIHLEGYDGRPFKPSKSMRRVMVQVWGPDASEYVGKSMTLYRDPDVTFGKDKVGGIRISHMSGIDKPVAMALTVTRGRRAPFRVQPLIDVELSPVRPPAVTEETPLDLAPMWNALKVAGFIDPQTQRQTVEGIIGREIASSADLTAEDMAAVMDELAALASGDAQ